MPTDDHARVQVKASLDRLGAFVFNRDPNVLSEFTEDALLVGSEQGEIAAGRAKLQSFFHQIFERPTRFSWEWDHIRASGTDELCWLFAEGVLITTGSEGQARAPYRLSAVLQRVEGRWMWHLFHGSEPA